MKEEISPIVKGQQLEAEEKNKTEKKEIYSNVLGEFEKLNIKEQDLEKISGFGELSDGQRFLILENFKQLNLGRIQDEAAVEYRKNTVESKFLGRIWKGISKKYQIAKLEKATANKIEKGGTKVHEETLQQLVNGVQKFGTEVKIQGGKLEIQYASGFKNLTPDQQKQVDEFNNAATEFSKIPYEWSLDTANKKDRKKYEEAKEKCGKVKGGILRLKETEVSKKDTCLYMNDVEMKVKLNQFLNSNPDVEKQLQNIKDKKVWLRALANVVTERGIYAGAGFLTRTATMSLIGLAGAPLAAAGVGSFLARKRGKETLSERSVLARKGTEDKSKEAKDFVDAEYIHESIDFLINELEKESLNADKKDEIIRSLKFHIQDAQNKIKDGTVNFGEKKNRLFNQHELIKKISEGAVQVEYNGSDNKKYQKDIEVIGEFLKKQDKTISAAQKKYLRNQMMRGAIISAGFATAGYAIRHFGEELGLWGGSKEVISSTIEDPADETPEKVVQHFKINEQPEVLAEKSQEIHQSLTNEEFEKIISNRHAISKNDISKDEWQEVVEKLKRMTPEQKIQYQEHLKKLGITSLLDESPEPPVKEPAKGVPKEVKEELVAAVAKQEAMKNIAAKVAEQEAALIKPLPEYAVQKNDNLWKIIGGMDEIKDLEGGRKSNAIANVIEAIKNDQTKLEALGFENAGDIHDLEVGQKIDLNEIKEILDTETIGEESIVEHAQELDNEIVENIEANDKSIAEFHKAHPDIPLNEKTTEWIINNPDVDFKDVIYDKNLGEIAIQETAPEQAVAAAEGAPEETIKTAKGEVRKIFNVAGMTPARLTEIERLTDANFKDGLDPYERSKVKFLYEHPELFKTPDQAQHLFNNSEVDFKLITDINITSGIDYGSLAEKMDASNFEGKNGIFYGKVLAGDEQLANMKKLLGGADVEKVAFGKNGKVIAELADGRKVSISNDGAKRSIEIKKGFWKKVFGKMFNTNLSENGLNSVKEELGVKVEDGAEERVDIPL